MDKQGRTRLTRGIRGYTRVNEVNFGRTSIVGHIVTHT